MTAPSNIKNHSLLRFVLVSPFSNRLLNFLGRTLLASWLIGLIWLSGLSIHPALAETNLTAAIPKESAAQMVASASEGDRMSAFIACLPKQLSKPSLKRALSEMGNDQLERIFNIKSNPKLSQAEIELKSCLNRKGFTSE